MRHEFRLHELPHRNEALARRQLVRQRQLQFASELRILAFLDRLNGNSKGSARSPTQSGAP